MQRIPILQKQNRRRLTVGARPRAYGSDYRQLDLFKRKHLPAHCKRLAHVQNRFALRFLARRDETFHVASASDEPLFVIGEEQHAAAPAFGETPLCEHRRESVASRDEPCEACCAQRRSRRRRSGWRMLSRNLSRKRRACAAGCKNNH